MDILKYLNFNVVKKYLGYFKEEDQLYNVLFKGSLWYENIFKFKMFTMFLISLFIFLDFEVGIYCV